MFSLYYRVGNSWPIGRLFSDECVYTAVQYRSIQLEKSFFSNVRATTCTIQSTYSRDGNGYSVNRMFFNLSVSNLGNRVLGKKI